MPAWLGFGGTMSLVNVLMLNLGLIAGIMLVLWLVSLPIGNSSIVDIFWGFGFVVVAWVTFLAVGSVSPRSLLIAVLTSLWGLRLAGYLAWRNSGKGEDYRYRAMRERLGRRFPLISLFMVFWLQGLIMWLVAFPIQTAYFGAAPLGWIDAVGASIWAVGWLFESVGDLQLAHFKANADNRGKVMDRGLWRYTRHPNYFGDFLVWWGLYLIAAAGGAWWTVFSPIIMSFLLIRVSGVALLERSLKTNRPGYEDYVARTSSFFPWPPRQIPPDHGT
jgi:steroid 5-alpha reductase family enzyme